MAVPSATSSLSPTSHSPLPLSERLKQQPLLPVQIRDAQITDLPTLIGMKKQMIVEDNADGYFDETTEHWQRDFFGAAPRFLAMIAEFVGQPVGMAIFHEQPLAGWPAPPIYIQSIFVRPPYRNQGIGRALMAAITAEAQRRGSHLVLLNVHQDNNTARRLYERGGFVRAACCLVYTLVLPQLLATASAVVETVPMCG